MAFRARCQIRLIVLGSIGPPASEVKSQAAGSGPTNCSICSFKAGGMFAGTAMVRRAA